MAKYREIPCKYYIALGQCKKGEGQHSIRRIVSIVINIVPVQR